jgi:hypothetical protein
MICVRRRPGGARQIVIIVRGVCIGKLCFGHDGSTGGTSIRLEDSSSISASYHFKSDVYMKQGSSTDSAIDQCAHRVGRIQNNRKLNSAAPGRRGMHRWFFIQQVAVVL